jgi:hypothetical protein
MSTLRDGLEENRESFVKADEKYAQNKVAEQHESVNVKKVHEDHKEARYDKAEWEHEVKDIEGK